jgi:hypothetical protein
VAVFLRGLADDRTAEMNRLADLSTALLDDTGECVHAMPYRASIAHRRSAIRRTWFEVADSRGNRDRSAAHASPRSDTSSYSERTPLMYEIRADGIDL